MQSTVQTLLSVTYANARTRFQLLCVSDRPVPTLPTIDHPSIHNRSQCSKSSQIFTIANIGLYPLDRIRLINGDERSVSQYMRV